MSQPTTTTTTTATTEPTMDCFTAMALAEQHLATCKQAVVETLDSYEQLPKPVVLNDTKCVELWRLYSVAQRDVIDAEKTRQRAERKCKMQLAKNLDEFADSIEKPTTTTTTTTTEPTKDCVVAMALAEQHLAACKKAVVETLNNYNQLPRPVVLNDTKHEELWRLFSAARLDEVDAEDTLRLANRECKRQLAKNLDKFADSIGKKHGVCVPDTF